MNDSLPLAQADMRSAYRHGGAGVLASSLAWLAAGIATLKALPQQAVWVLFIGGMAIHPVSTVLCKLFGSTGKHAKGNPLGALAIATVFWLIFSLPLAYVVSLHRIEWFFPAMLLVIGGRYLTFQTLYGVRLYWALGGVLCLLGVGLALARAPAPLSAFAGGAVEVLFAILLFRSSRET